MRSPLKAVLRDSLMTLRHKNENDPVASRHEVALTSAARPSSQGPSVATGRGVGLMLVLVPAMF